VTQLFSSAAAQLLDREVPESYLREWTDIVAAKQQVVETNFESVVVFSVGSESLALPISTVKEIVEGSAVHRLPHRSGGIVHGIVSVRGEILVCAALDFLLGLQKPLREVPLAPQTAKERLMICERNGDRLALVVSSVYGVHRYLPRDLRAIPATVAKAAATYTIGILPWKTNETIGCLDAELVFYGLNKGLA
jgi:chemotaxis-related protein WspD